MKNQIKIAAFDIDGTLFDEKRKEIPESAIRSLKRLNKNGIYVVLVTGRPPGSAKIVQDLGVDVAAYVCCNGHFVFDDAGEVIVDERFSSEIAEEVWRYCRNNNIALTWKYPDKVYVYQDSEEFEKVFSKNRNAKRANIIYDDTEYHWIETANNGLLACNRDQLKEFNKYFFGKCIAVDINGKTADLLLYDVNKCVGFKKLLDHLHVRKEDCIAFGDNNNDVDLINYVGIGVSMGNGSQLLKENADYITSDVNDDGIEKALTRYGLI